MVSSNPERALSKEALNFQTSCIPFFMVFNFAFAVTIVMFGCWWDIGPVHGGFDAHPRRLWDYYTLNLGLGLSMGFLICAAGFFAWNEPKPYIGIAITFCVAWILIGFGGGMMAATNPPDSSGTIVRLDDLVSWNEYYTKNPNANLEDQYTPWFRDDAEIDGHLLFHDDKIQEDISVLMVSQNDKIAEGIDIPKFFDELLRDEYDYVKDVAKQVEPYEEQPLYCREGEQGRDIRSSFYLYYGGGCYDRSYLAGFTTHENCVISSLLCSWNVKIRLYHHQYQAGTAWLVIGLLVLGNFALGAWEVANAKKGKRKSGPYSPEEKPLIKKITPAPPGSFVNTQTAVQREQSGASLPVEGEHITMF